MESPPPKRLKHDSDILESEVKIENTDDDGISDLSTMEFSKNSVHAVLQKVNDQKAGEFAVSGKLIDAPIIVISFKCGNNGRAHFPLYEDETPKIIQNFKQSPCKKGSETVIDTSVRNTWELEPQQFEILNPDWDLYIKEVVLPRINKEMLIHSPFTSSLYKLLMYKEGSFYKQHRDSEEKENGMFATLVIRLPSKYKGGELIVNHDGKTKTIDFKSGSTSPEEFSTYYSAFYSDCEHEVLPVTEGFHFCLIYNLISQNNDSIPVAPERSRLEMELKSVLRNWDYPYKIVYALKHDYSEKNLSLGDLKTTDKAIADILKYLSEKCALDVYLAVFKKTSRGHRYRGKYGFPDYSDEIDIDSNDEDCLYFKDYELNSLTALSGHEMLPKSILTVDWEDEVIPVDCFENIKSYDKTQGPTEYLGMCVKRFYRRGAIVFWPKKYICDVLRSSKASKSQLIDTFVKEVNLYKKKGTEVEEDWKRLLDFAEKVIHLKREYTEGEEKEEEHNKRSVFGALVKLKDLKLLQTFFECILTLNRQLLPLVVEQCENFGWKSFTDQLVSMFKKINGRKYAVELLDLMIENKTINEEKKEVFCETMRAILEKFNDHSSKEKEDRYSFANDVLQQEILASREEDMEYIVLVAQKIGFDMVELLQTLFEKFIIFDESTLPFVVNECTKYGWRSFIAQIPMMFKRVSDSHAAEMLKLLIGGEEDIVETNEDKKEVCCRVLDAICEKIEGRKIVDQEGDETLLHSLCISAHKIDFHTLKLFQTFDNLIIINQGMVPWVVNECNRYGWESFKVQIPLMFEKVFSVFDAAEILDLLIGTDVQDIADDKKEVCCKVFEIICQKIKKQKIPFPVFSKDAQHEEHKRLLYSLWSSAHKIDYDTEKLLQAFRHLIIMEHRMLSWTIDGCIATDWILFSEELPLMFEKISNIAGAVEIFEVLIGNDPLEITGDKKEICSKVLSVICNKMKDVTNKALYPLFPKAITEESEEKILYSLCLAAQKLNFSMMEFLKDRPTNIVVQVLINLAHSIISPRNVLEGQWLTIAKYFVTEMGNFLGKEMSLPSWQIQAENSCQCFDCKTLDEFLKSNLKTQEFKIRKERRLHLHGRIVCMVKAGAEITDHNHEEPLGGLKTGFLVVTKTVSGGQEDLNKRNNYAVMLPKLLAVMMELSN